MNDLEKKIQAECIEYLELNHWYVIKNFMNRRPYFRGISDITAVKNGRTIWIEFKTLTGKQNIEQINFEMEIKRHGGEYIIIRSLDELLNFLGTSRQKNLFLWSK